MVDVEITLMYKFLKFFTIYLQTASLHVISIKFYGYRQQATTTECSTLADQLSEGGRDDNNMKYIYIH